MRRSTTLAIRSRPRRQRPNRPTSDHFIDRIPISDDHLPHADAFHDRALSLARSGRLEEAAGAFREAVRLRPGDWQIRERLVAVLHLLGDIHSILIELSAVVDLCPDRRDLHSRLLYDRHHDPAWTPERALGDHRAWAQRHAGGARHEGTEADARHEGTEARRHEGERRRGEAMEGARPLRIGYLSAGFRDHPIGRFQEQALRHHDRTGFDVLCYADVRKPDAWTERLRAHVGHWRDVSKCSDDEIAQQIRADRIDILVDLDGHDGDRLLVFARKPAPVQVTYNGYVNTTGLPQMDWRITDALHDPPGMTERFHTERLWRLPECNWCYTPDGFEAATKRRSDVATKGGAEHQAEAADDSSAPFVAASLRRSVASAPTFGSLNKFIKASDPCLRVWAKLMARVPEARLLVAVPGDPAVNRFPLQRMIDHGIPADRVTVVGRSRTRREYLDRFGEIDIHLDTFPFNGITTTCDGLWQGVPTVTLEGNAFHSRAGVSILTNVGLPELIAKTEDEYIDIAASLANDRRRLADIRRTLRPRMAGSPLCDGPRLARALEEAYRAMWVEWCGKQT